jgi:hypothetical protein
LDTIIVAAALLVIVIGSATGVALYAANQTGARRQVVEAQYGLTTLQGIGNVLQQLMLTPSNSTFTIKYSFEYGVLALTDVGQTIISIQVDGGMSTLAVDPYRTIEYLEGYQTYGTNPLILSGPSDDAAAFPQLPNIEAIYGSFDGLRSHTALNMRVYYQLVNDGESLQTVQIYVLTLKAPTLTFGNSGTLRMQSNPTTEQYTSNIRKSATITISQPDPTNPTQQLYSYVNILPNPAQDTVLKVILTEVEVQLEASASG